MAAGKNDWPVFHAADCFCVLAVSPCRQWRLLKRQKTILRCKIIYGMSMHKVHGQTELILDRNNKAQVASAPLDVIVLARNPHTEYEYTQPTSNEGYAVNSCIGSQLG